MSIKDGITRYRATPDRFWLTRHYIALRTLGSFYVAAFAPNSLNYQALHSQGPAAWFFLAVLAAFSLLCLFEAFVTAFVPGVSLPLLRAHRHIGLILIAIGQVCVSILVAIYAPDSVALVAVFLVDAAVAAIVAFADLFARHKQDEGFR